MTVAAPSIRVSGRYLLAGRPLFGDLDLFLAAGQWHCMLGVSGAGKSTLLRLLAGLSTAGEFAGRICDEEGTSLSGRVAYMAQSDLLLPWLNVLENTMLGARLRGEHRDERRARDVLVRVGLADDAAKRPAQLSGGMRQRAALARTLMEDRPLVLLDEPFSALDARTRADMQELTAELLGRRTVVLVTHEPFEAARLADTIHLVTASGLRSATVAARPSGGAANDSSDRAAARAIRELDAPDVFQCASKLLQALRLPS